MGRITFRAQTIRFEADHSQKGLWISFLADRSALAALENAIDDHPENGWDITVQRHRKKRSLDANAYFWVLCGKLSEAVKVPPETIYRNLVKDIGGNTEVVCCRNEAVKKLIEGWRRNGIGWVADTIPSKLKGCTNVILYYGSSVFDTAQMARLIDLITAECKDQGIQTETPAQVREMLERWENSGQYFTG